jgi:quinol monooxygenase YgiN
VIFIVVRFTVLPDHADEWLTLVGPFTEATRAEPGNLWFDWSRSADDPHLYVLLEAFRDGAAGGAHVGSDHFRAAMTELPTWLAKTPEIVNVEVPGTEWSTLGEMTVPARDS